MLYTTYFANLKNLPDNIVPVSICGKAPEWYTGYQYKKLAPKWKFFQEWKQNHDNFYYTEHFFEEVLYKLNPAEVMNELNKLTGSTDMALVCYEKPGDFCHRHIVSAWLRYFGYSVREWSQNDAEKHGMAN